MNVPQLHPGDLCVVVASECLPTEMRHLTGRQCVITAATVARSGIYIAKSYQVVASDENTYRLCGHCLRKVNPPDEALGNWGEIERSTGWTPQAHHSGA